MSPIGVARLVNVSDPRQCRVRAAANDPGNTDSNGHTMTNRRKNFAEQVINLPGNVQENS